MAEPADEERQDFVKEITKMSVDFDRWYTDVVRKAEMADWSGIRGMMVIRPYGYAIWETIQRAFDEMIKSSGHENWAFPLLIPRSLFTKEADHVEGFAPEVAWVTRAGSGMAELEEPLVIRPTSETIIGPLVKRYIQSHRDLPLLTNQWCNVMRWEMRSRLFLRTREFFWQEGHTFHAGPEEAAREVDLILEYYRRIAEDWLAMPVLRGRKSEAEKFAGAEYTLSIEGLMRDGLALQAGTSHNLAQNFSRAYDVGFTNPSNRRELCHTTSWGISTRLIGGLVMAHGDDSGLIVPPRVAPVQVVIVPIGHRDAESRALLETFLRPVLAELSESGVRHRVDWRDERPGEKFAHWEVKGVPLRLEVGPRDVAASQAILVERIGRRKQPVPVAAIGERLRGELEGFQAELFARAQRFRDENTFEARGMADLVDHFRERNGFVWASWCGAAACEAEVKERTGATTRGMPLAGSQDAARELPAECAVCGMPATTPVVFARSY
ncbi:MAG: proline--tRNA ligase [Candidatus Dormibacteraceae bacterium]